MSAKTKTTDLTTGVIWKQLFLYFLPILAGGLFQQLYTTVDAVILAQFAGKAGMAAIDSIYNLLKLPVNFLIGLSTGATIIISQFFGAKDDHSLSRAVHTAIGFAFAGGLLLSVAGFFAAPLALQAMEVPEEIFGLTLNYVRIYFAGLSVSMLYNIGAGIMRAVGDSKTPFYVLIVSGVANIILDLFFVAGLGWSAPGAALATILSQTVSAVLVFVSLTKRQSPYQLYVRNIRFDPLIVKQIFSIGLPMALQSSFFPIANMMVQSSVNQTGTDNIVAWALCGKLDFLIWLAADSLGAAISTFVAQNYGAKQYARARRGVHVGLGMDLALILLISTILFLWSEPLGQLILNTADRELAVITGSLMHLMAPLYFLYVFGGVYGGAIRGTGESFLPMVITLLGTCAVRVLWTLFVPHGGNLLIILAVYPISWGATSVAFAVYYYLFHKKLKVTE